MNKLILEEIERMSLLSKYDNSKTLSEQSELDEYTYKGTPNVPAGNTATELQKSQPQKTTRPLQKPAITPPLQLKNVDSIKDFQDWLDVNVKGWATGYRDGIINKGQNGGGYGKYGPRTKKAWEQHKDKYLKTTSPQSMQSKGLKELPVKPEGPQKV
jgi:hypothetical protein